MRRSSIIWFVVALIMFAGAAGLTRIITHVDTSAAAVTAEAGDPAPIQIIGVYAAPAEEAVMRRVSAVMRAPADGDPSVTFNLPHELQPKLLLNNLSGDAACRSARDFAEVMKEDAGGPPANHVRLELTRMNSFGTDAVVIVPDPSDKDYSVTCQLRSAVQKPTFASRAMHLYFPAAEDYGTASFDPAREPAVAALYVVFGLGESAEDLTYGGGFESPDRFGYEQTRLMTPDTDLTVRWTEITGQEARDVILILIGTMIGIGVTVLIEGLRPLIERTDHRPAHPAAPAASAAQEATPGPGPSPAPGPG